MEPLTNKWLPKDLVREDYKTVASYLSTNPIKKKPISKQMTAVPIKRNMMLSKLVDKNEIELRKTMMEIVRGCPKVKQQKQTLRR